MMKPIQFRQGPRINMNLLKQEIDRRIDVITKMIKGMKGPESKQDIQKTYDVSNTSCQTEELNLPLQEIPVMSIGNTVISPTNAKKSGLTKNKQNQYVPSFCFTSKSKKLNPIQQSQQEALRTSRCMLQSEKKKNKKIDSNQQSVNKGHKQYPLKKKTVESNSIRDDVSQVITSFQSARKPNLTEKKNFQHFSSRNLKKFTTEQKIPVKFSVNSSIYDLSKSNSKISIRKGSMNLKPHQSLSGNNISSAFVSDYLVGDSSSNCPKRIIVSEEIKQSVQAEFESKLQNLKKKSGKQPKTNNIRISLLKRLQEKHEKAVEVTK